MKIYFQPVLLISKHNNMFYRHFNFICKKPGQNIYKNHQHGCHGEVRV